MVELLKKIIHKSLEKLGSVQIVSAKCGFTYEEFVNDKKTILSVTKCIEIVGEATKHIPDSIRVKYPEVPWREMAGIRDWLVHGYFKVNLEIVWMTVTMEFPELRPMIENVLADVDL